MMSVEVSPSLNGFTATVCLLGLQFTADARDAEDAVREAQLAAEAFAVSEAEEN